MKAKLLFLFLIFFIVISCNKDKYQTKPRVEFKEIKPSNKQVNSGDVLTIDLSVYDKEGDVTDSLFIIRTHTGTPSCGADPDTLSTSIPDYPTSEKSKITFRLQYEYNTNNTAYPKIQRIICVPARNDSTSFKFYVKDAAGNVSDPVTLDGVIFF